MKLSVITINLNDRNGLKRTIDSIVAQTFRDFEWIVIDGGSTDGSRELIEEYASHFAYWTSEPDKGIFNAMNKGIRIAKGDYILFLNSGDWLCSDSTLNEASAFLDGDIAYGDAVFHDDGAVARSTCYPDRMSLRFLYYNFVCHQSTFIKRIVFDDNYYDETLKVTSDWEFCVRQLFRNSTFRHIPVTICNFNGNGASSKDNTLLERERSLVISRYYPNAFKEDFCQVSCAESHLSNIAVTEFSVLCQKHRLLAKLITLTILIMRKL